MMTAEQQQEYVELYNLDLLDDTDKAAFEAELATNPALRKALAEHRAFVRLIQHKTSKTLVQNQMALIRKEHTHTIRRISDGMAVHMRRYWKTAAVAASVALFASSVTFYAAKQSFDKKLADSYSTLTVLANTQKSIAKSVKNITTQIKSEQPTGSSKRAATCFAVSNNGYAITNAHVVEGNNKIYIFTPDNIGHLATIIKIDAEKDLALLHIEEPEFAFSKNKLPYTISTREYNMSEKVFTIGFPKSSVVYNEGYVSSQVGQLDDTSRYQFELPSEPGVSGSPVFDASGHLVAIINSKESRGTNTTYALKSEQLKQFLNEQNIKVDGNASSAATRSKQVQNLQDFVLVVKTY